MEFIITNKETNRYIKIINVDYIEIKELGLKYSINNEPVLKFYNLEFNPNLDKLQIFK